MHGGNVWQGGDPSLWLDYSANVRPDGPPEWVRRALSAAIGRARYYPALDMAAAAKGLSDLLSLPAEAVLPTAGGASAIALASHLEAERMLLISPCFGEYAVQIRARGFEPVHVSLLREGRRLASLMEAAEPVLRQGDCLWLCNPLNPLGTAFSKEEAASLLSLAEDRGARLIVDEAFIDYCPDCSVRSLIPDHPRLAVTGSLTKILGIPGVRLGYLCSAEVDALRQYQLPWELSCFAEAVAAALPAHKAELLEEAALNDSRRAPFVRALEELGIYVYPGRANFVMADFGRDVSPIVAALRKKHILVRLCSDFPGLDDGRHLRLAVKDESQNAAFLAALKEAMTCAENP